MSNESTCSPAGFDADIQWHNGVQYEQSRQVVKTDFASGCSCLYSNDLQTRDHFRKAAGKPRANFSDAPAALSTAGAHSAPRVAGG